ncbi:MAG: flavodoxin [Ruminiclostridium sp.]
MKKVFSILMIIAVLFCFSACSNSSATISGGQTVSGYVPPDSLISSTSQEQTSSSTVQESSSTSSTSSSSTEPTASTAQPEQTGSTPETSSSSTEQSQQSSSSSQSEQTSTTAQETQSVAESTPEPSTPEIEQKALVVYFSCTGNTKSVAEKIAQLTGADLYEIVPAEPYTDADLNYNNDSCRANREMNDPSARPAIGSNTVDISAYDTVYIGYPIWWGTMPRIINTFLDTYDLSGKTVMPFCTSGGSGVSKSVSDIRAEEPAADVRDGLRASGSLDSSIDEWISRNGL